MKRVLIIEPDTEFLSELRQKLSAYDLDVRAESDPENIFDEINTHQPDLILLNYILNEGNGGTMTHQIKTNPETREIPVIMMSDYPDISLLWKKFGCNDYVLKPVNHSQLVEKIEFWLKNARIPILH